MTKVRFCLQVAAFTLLLSAWMFSAWAADENPLGGPAPLKETHSPVPTGIQKVKPDLPGTTAEIQHGSPARQPVTQFDQPRRPLRPHRKASPEPVWRRLEELTPAERENAVIELELPTGVPQEALAHARKVEEAWNSGDYEQALHLCRELGDLIDIYLVAVGISWKVPIETSNNGDWNVDVRIGPRDNIYNQEFDVHLATGHLLAAILYEQGGGGGFTVNFSADSGQTWAETYNWGPVGWLVTDISATVVGNYFWVGYVGEDAGGNQEEGRLRRFFTSDGTVDNGYGVQVVFDKGSVIRDLDLHSNVDYLNNRIYYSGILAGGSLVFFWDDLGGVSFTEIATGVTTAGRGLDSHWNPNFSNESMWFSWIDFTNTLRIAGWDGTNFTVHHNVPAGTFAFTTSIGCWSDTLLVVYEYEGPSHYYIRYRVSYSGGTGWTGGTVGDISLPCSEPHVTGRGGVGFHVLYEVDVAGEPDSVMYTWRAYWPGVWATPVPINDYDILAGFPGSAPKIEWLPGNNYGAAYVSWTAENCWFDRSDWVGVAESPSVSTPKGFSLSQTYPNPFHSKTTISFTLPSSLDADLAIHDVSGRRIATLMSGSLKAGTHSVTWDGKNSSGRDVPSGVYFYRLIARDPALSEAEVFSNTKKAVLLR